MQIILLIYSFTFSNLPDAIIQSHVGAHTRSNGGCDLYNNACVAVAGLLEKFSFSQHEAEKVPFPVLFS